MAQAREGSNAVPGRDPIKENTIAHEERVQLSVRAERGDAAAQAEMGRIYEKGNGVTRDPAEALSWYRKAADQGHAEAQTLLGQIYAKGHGVDRNMATAVSWYRRAALQGEHRAQSFLGLAIMKGEGVKGDDVEALMWFTLASAGNEPMEGFWSRKIILARMSQEQIAESKKCALRFVPQKETAGIPPPIPMPEAKPEVVGDGVMMQPSP